MHRRPRLSPLRREDQPVRRGSATRHIVGPLVAAWKRGVAPERRARQSIGQLPALAGQGPVIADNRKLPPVTLVNFTVSSVKAWHGVSGALSVKNLLDRRWDAVAPTAYASASSGSSAPDLMFDRVPMDGRSIWLQLHYDLGF
ncbi:MAG: TonB-dependent receptor [Betaproteobacteria bacterium]|nr:TonB-dependent receptor [Betaproteobacteria bacterium]